MTCEYQFRFGKFWQIQAQTSMALSKPERRNENHMCSSIESGLQAKTKSITKMTRIQGIHLWTTPYFFCQQTLNTEPAIWGQRLRRIISHYRTTNRNQKFEVTYEVFVDLHASKIKVISLVVSKVFGEKATTTEQAFPERWNIWESWKSDHGTLRSLVYIVHAEPSVWTYHMWWHTWYENNGPQP